MTDRANHQDAIMCLIMVVSVLAYTFLLNPLLIKQLPQPFSSLVFIALMLVIISGFIIYDKLYRQQPQTAKENGEASPRSQGI